jgi:hypothetical protein
MVNEDSDALGFSSERGNGYVLILDELSHHSTTDAKDMEGLLNSLRDEDFGLLGIFDDSAATSEVELSAQARRSLGLYGPSDPGAHEHMILFLETHPEVDAVLWCGKVGEDLLHSAYLFCQVDFEDQVVFKTLQGEHN